jgi:hypothetical protein
MLNVYAMRVMGISGLLRLRGRQRGVAKMSDITNFTDECEICGAKCNLLEFFYDRYEYYICPSCAVKNNDEWLENKLKEWNYVDTKDIVEFSLWHESLRVELEVIKYFYQLKKEAQENQETSGFIKWLGNVESDIVKIIRKRDEDE